MAASLKSRFFRYSGMDRARAPYAEYRFGLAQGQPRLVPALNRGTLCWRSCGQDCSKGCPASSLNAPQKTYLH